jgi:hypothetical protein
VSVPIARAALHTSDSLYRDGRVIVVNRQVQPYASTFFNIGKCACATLRCACLLMHTNSQRHFQRKYRWRKYRCLGSPTETVAIGKILFRNGNLTSALAGWWQRLWAGSGCGGSGRAPGWCGWAVASLLRRCCGGAVCLRPVISLLAQSVVVGEVG